MPQNLRYLAVHGLGDQRGTDWHAPWQASIERTFDSFGLGAKTPGLDPEIYGYDDIFERVDLGFDETLRALARLIGSGIGSSIEEIADWLRGGTRSRSTSRGIDDSIRWTAGYVVAWLEDEEFREKTRKGLLKKIKAHRPQVLLAHSLGTMVTYDALTHPSAVRDEEIQEILSGMIYVVLGSQIGNPFVKKNLVPGRRLLVPGKIRHFMHLYNQHDKVLTNRIRIHDQRFIELDTFFDHRCHNLHHCPEGYLEHPATVRYLWEPVARLLSTRSRTRSLDAIEKPLKLPLLSKLTIPQKRESRKRALLVGINDYANPEDRLEGCVNDVFLLSSVLQECGFPADNIRVVLNERATTHEILERFAWLLEDVRAGDKLVFYFSGHGARSPKYGPDFEVEGFEETLVTHDFDWSEGTGISDEMINGLYSQLPYGVHLSFIFDCCHSGGMHKNGAARVRGLNPPDDIRHRSMEWDSERRIWKPRSVAPIAPNFSGNKELNQKFMGEELTTYRLGCDIRQRAIPQKVYTKIKKASATDDEFPYLPVILYACKDSEYAYEYRHGVESFGAFSYVMAATLRKQGKITYEDLIREARSTIQSELNFSQTPDCLGPESILKSEIPHLG